MADQYTHGLAADWRARHAMSTASKVGGSYTGWTPREGSASAYLKLAAVSLFGAGINHSTARAAVLALTEIGAPLLQKAA